MAMGGMRYACTRMPYAPMHHEHAHARTNTAHYACTPRTPCQAQHGRKSWVGSYSCTPSVPRLLQRGTAGIYNTVASGRGRPACHARMRPRVIHKGRTFTPNAGLQKGVPTNAHSGRPGSTPSHSDTSLPSSCQFRHHAPLRSRSPAGAQGRGLRPHRAARPAQELLAPPRYALFATQWLTGLALGISNGADEGDPSLPAKRR